MDFITGQELLERCKEEQFPISYIMKCREAEHGILSDKETDEKLQTALSIMKAAANEPLINPKRSIGGLIGGEAKRIEQHLTSENNIAGTLLSKAIAYSMAVLETNSSMGLIVAAPTAGSSGVIPGVLLAIQEAKNVSDQMLCSGLLNASAVGYLIMRNATVSGAEAGCQAEVGASSAMAASAAVEILGGTPEMCLHAAGFALSNLLGLVCDPIAGLVEAPCQSRNTIGAANAITCAEIALSGVTHIIPFDEMVDAMYRVGKGIPFELRETSMGGCAATPTGCSTCVSHGSL